MDPIESPRVDRTIVCVECGGTAHLLWWEADEEDPTPPEVLVYRCEDCWDRFDVVTAEEES